jgi:hypothetical protein
MQPPSDAVTERREAARDAAPPLLPLWSEGRTAEALAAARERLSLGRDLSSAARAEALLLLSMEAETRDDFEGATRLAVEAAAAEPRFIHARLRHASMLRRTGAWREGLALAEAALRDWPRQPATRIELAQCLTEAGRHEDAKRQYQVAVRLSPDLAAAHMGLAETLLMTEDWMPGWREYAWRTRMPAVAKDKPKLSLPPWNGMRLPGRRLVLVADQGYGDCIQFCRFLPRAAERVGSVTLAVSEKLSGLLRRMPGVAAFVNRWEDIPKESEAYATLSDLPLLFGGDEADLAAPACYLPIEAPRKAAWRARLSRDAGDSLKVGLCWSGRTGHLHNRQRSLRLATLAPLAGLSGVTFFSLQFDEQKRQVADWPAGRAPLVDLAADLEGFDETAHCLAALDLVITIDTVTAHLAAAVGTPTWTLLRRIADWRWLERREDSPWYPTMRLIRQDERRNWETVADRAAQDLAAVLAGDRSRLLPPGRG